MTKGINPTFIILLGMSLFCGVTAMVVGIFPFTDEIFIESQPGMKIASIVMWMVGGIMVITFYYYKKKLDGLMG